VATSRTPARGASEEVATMPLVAFWNINTGKGSFGDRITAFADWCQEVDPDVLVLEEVSHTLEDSLPTLTNMDEIVHVNTRDKNLKKSTKQIWALQRPGFGFEGRALRLTEYENAIRMAVKLTHTKLKMVIWGLHANASSSGGRHAVEMALETINDYPETVMGGDFNRSFDDAAKISKGLAYRCWSWQSNALRFSQWKKQEGWIMKNPDALFHLDKKNCGYLTVKPTEKGVIDFVIAGSKRTVKPLRNCYHEETWIAILKSFDHAPVVYRID
jgi:hypothetical protein